MFVSRWLSCASPTFILKFYESKMYAVYTDHIRTRTVNFRYFCTLRKLIFLKNCITLLLYSANKWYSLLVTVLSVGEFVFPPPLLLSTKESPQ